MKNTHTHPHPARHPAVLALAVAAAVSVTGCAVTPSAITDTDRQGRIAQDLEAMFAGQEPVTQAITLAEAIARALKYNLDARVKLYEQALAMRIHDTESVQMLPRMALRAGYTSRNNVNASSSQSVTTGEESLETSTSEEQDRTLGDVTVAWNVLDFGVSYVNALQNADRVAIAQERKRKTIQNIIQDVRYAYWRAYAAQELRAPLLDQIAKAQDALKQSETLSSLKTNNPEVQLRYRKELIEELRNLNTMRRDLEVAHTELAALMNLRPGSPFMLAPASQIDPGDLNVPPDQLEQLALQNRPELREEDYRLRIDRQEARKALLRMLPGLELTADGHYDSNGFLLNNNWFNAGLSITWNLLNVFAYPAAQRQAEAQETLDHARRQALTLAAMTQTHLSAERYRVARDHFTLATKLDAVNDDLSALVSAGVKADAKSRLEDVSTRTGAFSARMNRHLAYAEVQNALGRIYNSIGFDPIPDTVSSDMPVAQLAQAIETHWGQVRL